jgi:hypothetical protein
MPLDAKFARVRVWLLGSIKAALGATLGDLRLEREGRIELRATRAASPTAVRSPTALPGDRRARLREQIQRERALAAQRAAEA